MTKKKIESSDELPTNSTSGPTEFTVTTSTGGVVRTYTVDIHGKEAEKLANEYASKIGGKII